MIPDEIANGFLSILEAEQVQTERMEAYLHEGFHRIGNALGPTVGILPHVVESLAAINERLTEINERITAIEAALMGPEDP